jgi:tryptophanyl-tRNA synthetase
MDLGVDQDVHVSTARDLVNQFGAGLEGHVCGSPQLVTRQLDTVSGIKKQSGTGSGGHPKIKNRKKFLKFFYNDIFMG